MAVKTSTTPVIRHILGDLALRILTFTSVHTNDTFQVAGVSDILAVIPVPIASDATGVGASWSGNVVTLGFSATACTVLVLSRVG